MNKKLLTAVVGATLAVAGNAANAIDLKISGHLARGVMWADDGITSEIYHVDMSTSTSRIRFLASDDLLPGIKAGVTWENGYQSNASGSVTQSARTVAATLSERWQEVWFSGAFGKLGIGQGDSATKDAGGVDLSGATLGAGAAAHDVGGGIMFRTSTGGTNQSLSTVLNNFDGTRYDRISYTSPALGPVTFVATTGYTGQVDTNEFAARLNVDLGGIGKLAGAVGFAKADSLTEAEGNVETVSASASWLAPYGLNVTVAYAQRENDATLDADFTRLQVGYIAGEHAVAVGYAMGNDQVTTGDEAEQVYISYNFKPKPWADIFASVKQASFDPATGVDLEDILVVLVGSRIVF